MRKSTSILCLSLVVMLGACKNRSVSPEVVPDDGHLHAALVNTDTITVDGRIDEEVWQWTDSTGPFVAPGSGERVADSPVQAEAYIVWSEEALYVAVVVEDANPNSPFTADAVDPHIWEQSAAVEVMIQPGDPGDNLNYYEIQVDTNRAVWDTRFDDYNAPITGSGADRQFGHQDWDAQLERAVVVEDDRYTIELALPWSTLSDERTAIPPEAGDIWRINFYSFRDGQRHALAWSPILGEGNFHKTSQFGTVLFDDLAGCCL